MATDALSQRQRASNAFTPSDGETVLRNEFGNRIWFGGGMLGWLIITDRRIVHRPVWCLWVIKRIEIDISDVVAVSRVKVAGFSNNGVAIRTASDQVTEFQVWNATDIVKVIADVASGIEPKVIDHE